MRLVYALLLVALTLACDRSDQTSPAHPDSARSTGSTQVPASQGPTARFEDYVVSDTTLGRPRPAPVQLASAEYGRMYRTKLREGAAVGPNFAGQYTVVLWGCGTGCQILSVVDARTGRASRETLLIANGVRFRRDSRLLYVDPWTPETPPNCGSCGTPALYEWRDGRFIPLGPGPHPHLGGHRPWGS